MSNLVTRLQARLGRSPTDGRLIYAIGDVHGRVDLLDRLVREIGKDVLATGRTDRAVLVFIGDYVDRGPASRQVLDRVIALKGGAEFEVRALKGNHEQALMAFLQDPSTGPAWCVHGGSETLLDYGVTPPANQTDADAWQRARDAFALALPLRHLNFLRGLKLMAAIGDYVFVHAGVRQGVALVAQTEADLLWIRDEFLSAQGPFEKVVVHGHTPCEAVSMADDRINIDTGAYATGILTAVRLENAERRFIQVGGAERAVVDIHAVAGRRRTAIAGGRPVAPADGSMLSGVTLALSAVLLILALFLMRPVPPEVRELGRRLTLPTPAAAAPRPAATPVQARAPPVSSAPGIRPMPASTVSPPSREAVVVQVGAFPSAALADANWRTLNATLKGQLAGRTMTVEVGRSGGRAVYHSFVVGFASHADAVRFCGVLSAAGRSCSVGSSP